MPRAFFRYFEGVFLPPFAPAEHGLILTVILNSIIRADRLGLLAVAVKQ
ncbi:MAG: hypothetical protein ACI9WS_001952 [Paraglaciecola psychrophila]|jgi:hypothetical protein